MSNGSTQNTIIEVPQNGVNRALAKAVNQINTLSQNISDTGETILEVAGEVEEAVQTITQFSSYFDIQQVNQEDILIFEGVAFKNKPKDILLDGGNF